MKRKAASILLVITLLGTSAAYAQTETLDDFNYDLQEETLWEETEEEAEQEDGSQEDPMEIEEEEEAQAEELIPEDQTPASDNEELIYEDNEWILNEYPEQDDGVYEEELLTSEEEELISDEMEVSAVNAASYSNYMHDPVKRPTYASASKVTVTDTGNGMVKKNGKVQVILNGEKYVNGSFRYNGKYYYADKNGYLISGWGKFLKKDRSEGSILDSDYNFKYYDPSTYELQYGLQTIDGIPHYFNETGTMLINRAVTIDQKFYYADEYGICSQVKLSYGNILNSETDQNNGNYLARNQVQTVDADTFAGQNGEYSFRAKFYSNRTTVEPVGFTPQNIGNHMIGALTNDSMKGSIGAMYRNVGSYKGREIDALILAKDWEYFTLGEDHELGYFVINKEAIGLCMANLKSLTAEMKFYDHETGEPVTVKGYATFSDIDISQSLSILSPVDEVFVDQSCVLYKDPNSLSFSAPFELNRVGSRITDEDKTNWVQANYSSSSLVFRFGASHDHYRFVYNNSPVIISGSYVWAKDYTGSIYDYHVINSNGELINSWQGLYFLRLGGVSIPPISKTVSDADESNVFENRLSEKEESFIYTLSHNIPGESEAYYYDSYQVSDTIHEDLHIDAEQIYVTDDGNNDRTGSFDIAVKDQTVTFSAKPEMLSREEFYDNTYHYYIGVTIREDKDLSTFTEDDYTVLNEGMVSFSRLGSTEDSTSNEVITRYRCIPEFLPVGEITIIKRIPEKKILWAHGNPTFLFSVSGTDAEGRSHTYETAVCFTEGSYDVEEDYAVLSTVIKNIPVGQYEISELKTLSYDLKDVYSVTDNVTVSGTVGMAQLTAEKTAAAIGFTNDQDDYHNFRHNDYVRNDIPVLIQ